MAILFTLTEWKHVRAELERVIQAADKTQAQIAAAGRVSGQTYISKVKDYPDTSLGPKLMNLIGALEGVGIKMSDFFVAVEKRAEGLSPLAPAASLPMMSKDDELALKIGRLILETHRRIAALLPGPQKRRHGSRQIPR